MSLPPLPLTTTAEHAPLAPAAAEEGIPLHPAPNLAPLTVHEEEEQPYFEPGPALPDRPPFKVRGRGCGAACPRVRRAKCCAVRRAGPRRS